MDDFRPIEVSDPKFYKVWFDRINALDNTNSLRVKMLSATPMLDQPNEINVLCSLLKEKHTKIDSDITKLSKSDLINCLHQLDESTSSIIFSEEVNDDSKEYHPGSENQ